MAVGTPQLTTSQQRKYFKVRTDLEVTKQVHRGETCYIIKDPLALRYFRMSDVEFRVFSLLDGTHSVEDIQKIIHEEFADVELTKDSISHFFLQLKQVNFLERMYAKESRLLYERAKKREKMFSFVGKMKNVFFIKFSVCDPDRFLDKTLPYVRWIFTKPFGYLCAFVMAIALFIAFKDMENMAAQFESILTLRNLVFFWAVFVVVKMIHEVGHAYTCKLFGGEVHELGLLFMFFTPCLYCDVSDAWIFQKRAHRLWVSSAGIFVELFMASVACIVWWSSNDVIIKPLAYSTMFLCSISSLFFNANPLMKFDGYYMLSDYLEMPNLRNKAVQRTGDLLKKYILGMDMPEDEIQDPDNRLYVIYGIASSLYIYIFVFAICGFTMSMIYILGLYMMVSMVVGMLVFPIRKMVTFLMKNRRNMRIKKHRLYVLGSIGGVLLGLFLFFKMDYEIKTYCVIEPSSRVAIRAPDLGAFGGSFVDELRVVEGERVKQGAPIAVLTNLRLEGALVEQQVQIAVKEKELIEARGRQDQNKVAEIEGIIKSYKEEASKIAAMLDGLTLRAPFTGTVMIPEQAQLAQDKQEGQDRKEVVLAKKDTIGLKKGAYVNAKDDPICSICDTDKVVVRAVVLDYDIANVAPPDASRPGARVTLRLHSNPDRRFEGAVLKKPVAYREFVKDMDPALLAVFGGVVAVNHWGEPMDHYFVVVISIDNAEGVLRPGMTGWAKIHAGRKTLGQRSWAVLRQKARDMFRM